MEDAQEEIDFPSSFYEFCLTHITTCCFDDGRLVVCGEDQTRSHTKGADALWAQNIYGLILQISEMQVGPTLLKKCLVRIPGLFEVLLKPHSYLRNAALPAEFEIQNSD